MVEEFKQEIFKIIETKLDLPNFINMVELLLNLELQSRGFEFEFIRPFSNFPIIVMEIFKKPSLISSKNELSNDRLFELIINSHLKRIFIEFRENSRNIYKFLFDQSFTDINFEFITFEDIFKLYKTQLKDTLFFDPQEEINVNGILTIFKTEEIHDYKKLNNSFQISWNRNNIFDLIMIYQENITKYLPEIRAFAVENILRNDLEELHSRQENNNQNYINLLRLSFFNKEIVLFLGAGVSYSENIPSWDQLLKKMMHDLVFLKGKIYHLTLNHAERQYFSEILHYLNKFDPLQEARYIKRINKDMFEFLHSNLYSFNYFNNLNFNSDLLNSIIKFIYRKKQGVSSIITYNFDDILECYIDKYNSQKSNKISYCSIYRDDKSPNKKELGIYHVHGFVPFEKHKYVDIPKDGLINDEESYNKIIFDSFYWGNIIQLHNLRENICLFIGVSLHDPNLRRLLEIEKKKIGTIKHFVIMKKTKPSELKDFETKYMNNVIGVHDSYDYKKKLKYFAIIYDRLSELVANELGINIIWIKKYDEISLILESISQILIKGVITSKYEKDGKYYFQIRGREYRIKQEYYNKYNGGDIIDLNREHIEFRS